MTIDITEHLPLVGWVVDRYYKRCINGRIEREDLISAGYEGLIRAGEKFDPERGFAFTTYAVGWVRSFIGKYIQDNARLVRVPVYRQDEARAGKRQLTPERLRWLDAPYGVDSLYDFMGSDDPAQSNALATDDVRRLVVSITDKRARFAVRQWYLRDRTLEEIGANIGVTRERVRQLVLRGLAEMRLYIKLSGPRQRPETAAVPTLTQEQRWREALAIYKARPTTIRSE